MRRWVIEVFTEFNTDPSVGYWSVLYTFPHHTEMATLLARLKEVRGVRSFNEARKLFKSTSRGESIPKHYSICVSAVRLRNPATGDIIMGDIL